MMTKTIEPNHLARDIQRLCNRAGLAILGHADGTIEVTDASEWERDGEDLPVFQFTRAGEQLDTGILPPKRQAAADKERKRIMDEMKRRKTIIHQVTRALGRARTLADGRVQERMQTETTYAGEEQPVIKKFWVDVEGDDDETEGE